MTQYSSGSNSSTSSIGQGDFKDNEDRVLEEKLMVLGTLIHI